MDRRTFVKSASLSVLGLALPSFEYKLKYFRLVNNLDNIDRYAGMMSLKVFTLIPFYIGKQEIDLYEVKLGPQTYPMPLIFNDLSEITLEHEIRLLDCAARANKGMYKKTEEHNRRLTYKGHSFWIKPGRFFEVAKGGDGRYCMLVSRPDEVISDV
jgi:hypothetical protein